MSLIGVDLKVKDYDTVGVGDIVKYKGNWCMIVQTSTENNTFGYMIVTLSDGEWKSFIKPSLDELKNYLGRHSVKFVYGVDWFPSEKLHIMLGVKDDD